MAASRADVNKWIGRAKLNGKKFIISISDRWDYEDYPVYCNNVDEVAKEIPSYQTKMWRINEIIKIDGDVVTENLNEYTYV